MEQKDLLDALVQTKRIAAMLGETMDLSRQMADAADRNDQVVVQMLLNMREDPIEKLKLADQALRNQRAALPPQDGQCLADLLNGAPPQNEQEKMLAAQVGANAARLKQLLELDQALNRRLTGERSVYQ